MRPNTISLQFCLMAPVALCSPIPMVLVTDLGAAAVAAHPPAHVAPLRPTHALPETIILQLEEDEDEDQVTIDNRPITPSSTADSSAVLAAPRPLSTEYLLSLSKHPWARRKGGSAGVASKLSNPPADAVVVVKSSMTQMEMGIVTEETDGVPVTLSRIGMPCHYARRARGHNDVIAVSLIIVFVAVVVVVETFSR